MEKHRQIKIQVAVEWPFHKLSCLGAKKCIKDSFKAGLTAAVKKCALDLNYLLILSFSEILLEFS